MEKVKKLIIIGDSAFAQIAYEYFTHDSEFDVIAFAVEREYLNKNELFGLPVIAFEDISRTYSPDQYYVFVALVYTQLNRPRTRLYLEAKKMGYKIASYVSSHAFVWNNVKYGENVFIFEDNTIQPFAEIGNNVIIWSGNHIGHHSRIFDNCFIASHIVLSGFSEIRENCFVGVNATFANNIVVGKDCLIGAGAIVLKDTPPNQVYGEKMTVPKEYTALDYYKISE